ncbi:MAG TPA: nucleotidyltransferase family protein [Terriglobia bacterium]|nr:nucleotidyltransferase family protein [Terriglobia bacterium]
MKAYLLAAGLGTRLKPITDHIPKCLVPIGGRPLLSIWLDICEDLGISEVLINTHHLAQQVRDWAAAQISPIRVHLVHEQTLLGSAGTLAANSAFAGGDEYFYILYADNLVDADLRVLESCHSRHGGVLTMGLFRSPKPEDCGIVTLTDAGLISSFEEKPERPRTNLANAGIFLARRKLFEYLPASGFADLGKDVLPKLVGEMWGQVLDGYLLDIGTLENYQRALSDWPAVAQPSYQKERYGRAKAAKAS